ncbi:MAG: hypothetical protein K0B08_09100 [Bacteroidales bacterium]|nr:hypothetical protein [Bacteroidales bacterium]
MKKIIFTTLGLILLTSVSLAQRCEDFKERRARVQAMKIGYLTEKLQLTPEEAQVFWPVFNEFEQKRIDIEMNLSDQVHKKRPDVEQMSDSEIDTFLKNRIQQEEQIIALKKEYHEKLKKVISIRKIYNLYEAEAGFKRVLLERLQEGKDPAGKPKK